MDVDGTLIRLISFFQRLPASAQEASKEPHREIFENLRRFCVIGSTFAEIARILDYVTRNMRGSDSFWYIKARGHFAYYQFPRISRVIA